MFHANFHAIVPNCTDGAFALYCQILKNRLTKRFFRFINRFAHDSYTIIKNYTANLVEQTATLQIEV